MTKEKIFIQGYGYSGGTLIGDFIKEFDGMNYLYRSEFDLARASGGLYEIGELIDNSSAFVKDSLIRRYLKLARFLASDKGFNDFYKRQFKKISDKFIEKLIKYNPYSKSRYFCPHEAIIFPKRNLFEKIFLSFYLNKLRQKIKEENFDTHTYYLNKLSEDEYIKIASNFLEELFDVLPKGRVVLHHPLNIQNQKIDTQIKYWKNFKVIFPDKDPRDIYCTINNESRKISFLKPFCDADNFIDNFKLTRLYHEHNLKLLGENAVYIRCEDFVFNYDNTKDKIIKFLNLDKNTHKEKYKYFNPEISAKNIGIYKNFKDQKAIKKIEQNLEKYLHTS